MGSVLGPGCVVCSLVGLCYLAGIYYVMSFWTVMENPLRFAELVNDKNADVWGAVMPMAVSAALMPLALQRNLSALSFTSTMSVIIFLILTASLIIMVVCGSGLGMKNMVRREPSIIDDPTHPCHDHAV